MNWLSKAKKLPLNGKTRALCECKLSGSKSLIINNKAKCYNAYCFRCGRKEFEPKGKLSITEVQDMHFDLTKLEVNGKIELPKDYTEELPAEARQWLYKGGLYEPLWKKYHIVYSKNMQRVLLPIFSYNSTISSSQKSSDLLWYQGRSLHPNKTPKYIQPDADKSNVLFRSLNQSGDTVVVTEDILSAIVVGEIMPAVSILGTKLSAYQINEISKFKNVIIHLDGDTAGIVGANEAKKALSLLTNVTVVKTDKDPKEYSYKELINIYKRGQ